MGNMLFSTKLVKRLAEVYTDFGSFGLDDEIKYLALAGNDDIKYLRKLVQMQVKEDKELKNESI